MTKLIIFDCDGVLVDSETIRGEVYSRVLSNFGHAITKRDFVQFYSGVSDNTMAKIIKDKTGMKMPESLLQEGLTLMLKEFETRLQPLLKPLLQELNVLGIPTCIASGSQHHRIIHSLRVTNQAQFFDENRIFNAEQVQRGKPAPDLFLFAAEKMKFSPENCLIIEDSSAGIQAAQAAGIEVFAFTGASHAQHDWYQELLQEYDVPIAVSLEELSKLVLDNILMAA